MFGGGHYCERYVQEFEQYIYCNLELKEDRTPFEEFKDGKTLLEALFFLKNKSLSLKENTLHFIGEIQEVPEALNILRYIYEDSPGLALIAAGSMLETLYNKNIHFPVGRVTFRVLRTVSFPEFLDAAGETAALEQLKRILLAGNVSGRLMKLFHTFALVRGMPEIINHYIQNRDLTALAPFI